MTRKPQMRIVGAREARDSWRTTLERVAAGEQLILLRNASPAAVMVPPTFYVAAVDKLREPPLASRTSVGMAAARTNWSATLDLVETDGKFVQLLRSNVEVAHLLPVPWYSQALEKLGGPQLKV
ncbi:type II toxin-antitoxin system Phd/YefM family antitoxin [Micromonospora sp. NPDC047730]|uniref:type II toxin-antitoxin system Phd/YefM family antitoxin n=1 Tax=Micromonospora sp. NPDC047730 TaxID=3364253 RepID=UPI0037215712